MLSANQQGPITSAHQHIKKQYVLTPTVPQHVQRQPGRTHPVSPHAPLSPTPRHKASQ